MNNFWWNRHWTFAARGGHAGFQAARFLTVSVVAFLIQLAILELLITRPTCRRSPRRRSRSCSRRRSTSSATSCGASAWIDPAARGGARRSWSLVALALPAAAQAGNESWVTPTSMTKPPEGKRLNAEDGPGEGRGDEDRQGDAPQAPTLRALGYLDTVHRRLADPLRDPREGAGRGRLDDATGAVTHVWTGPQVLWGMARGVPGAFGRKLNAPYIWLPLCLAVPLPFFDPRRPFRLLHLDLLVMLGFGVSHFYFNRADISASTPLAYPVLAYLFVRALMIGFGRASAKDRSSRSCRSCGSPPASIFLAGFRYGAEHVRLERDRRRLRGRARRQPRRARAVALRDWNLDWHPNTYGPVNYLAYVPFEWIWPNTGPGTTCRPRTPRRSLRPADHARHVRARHAAARGRGRQALGVALAYAWVAFPYTTYVLESNSNDSLTAMFVVWALVVHELAGDARRAGRARRRGEVRAVGARAAAGAPVAANGAAQQWFLFLSASSPSARS